MYSLILMTALASNGPDALTHGRFYRRAVRAATSCYGCMGVTFPITSGCFGCFGSCTGCYGTRVGCLGSASYGCAGCYGSGMGCYGSGMGCYGSGMGCYGGGRIYVGSLGSGSVLGADPGYIGIAAESAPPQASGTIHLASRSSSKASLARLILHVPADAKVWIDDTPMKSTSTVRHFHSPELDPTQTYFYEIKVAYERAGRMVEKRETVVVRAGDVKELAIGMEGRDPTTVADRRD